MSKCFWQDRLAYLTYVVNATLIHQSSSLTDAAPHRSLRNGAQRNRMRATSVIRRGHAHASRGGVGGGGEEKKDDADLLRRSLPLMAAEGKDRHHHHHHHHRRRKRGAWSLFALGRFSSQTSSSSLSLPSSLRVAFAKGLLFCGLLLFSLFVVVYNSGSRGAWMESSLFSHVHVVNTNLKVTIPFSGSRAIGRPGPFLSTKEDYYEPEYGNLDFYFIKKDRVARKITYSINHRFRKAGSIRRESKRYANDKTYYYAFDDDEKRNPIHGWGHYAEDHDPTEYHCRQTAMHREQFPTCNDFHALDFGMYASLGLGKYLGGKGA